MRINTLTNFQILDPITGPAEDLGIRLSFNTTAISPNLSGENNSSKDKQESIKIEGDSSDGSGHGRGGDITDFSLKHYGDNNNMISRFNEEPKLNEILYEDNVISNNANNTNSDSSPVYYHIPSLCDILIGFPTQKGFIAYRKPEIGSWYMNAIVQVFSKHSHDTDLCAMLNMVNSLISNEVTNTGKKQMSEYTSKLTKPYFHFFPGKTKRKFCQNKKKYKFKIVVIL